jgi:hypothetical protein
MKPLRFFLDTHDRSRKTFPEKLTPEEFEVFFAQYERACYEEGYADGRAFCLKYGARRRRREVGARPGRTAVRLHLGNYNRHSGRYVFPAPGGSLTAEHQGEEVRG